MISMKKKRFIYLPSASADICEMKVLVAVYSWWSRNTRVEEIADVGFVDEMLEIEPGVLVLELTDSWALGSWE